MALENKYLRKSTKIASRIVDGEAVVVVPAGGVVYVLNEVGSKILELSDGTRNPEGIIKLISDEFNVSLEQAQKDVLNFIEELKEKGILVLE